VNLASRLESVSGRNRIIISPATKAELERLDPNLASRCRPLPPVQLKGIAGDVEIYEVLWREDAANGAGTVQAQA
jgi:class 3 adenylate cyclase